MIKKSWGPLINIKLYGLEYYYVPLKLKSGIKEVDEVPLS